ncbi:hypothetical protein [Bacillus sp. FJAT-50079]|uniref:hypothetical protein n=1 Tax=Bacillus sp. FJAT-50079 TaxID=2833577 RepID=UPI001BC8DF34|nr:hypothetical protein [Bacillus sp. FJAT-50079]MBS4209301.1 hypothetical protein [Bacillus sp. FJAT-50079]
MKYLFLAILSAFFLSGCIRIQSNTSLMIPPELPGKEAEITAAFSTYLPKNAELLTPVNNQINGPTLLVDLDGDGVDEAVLFYKTEDRTERLKGLILSYKNGWKKLAEIDGIGTRLIDLQFADLSNDGKKEIIAGFAYSENSTEHGLLVYEIFSNHTPTLLLDSAYTGFLLDDFDHGGKDSLVLLKFDKGKQNTVFLYQYHDQHLQIMNQLELDPYINGYEEIISGQISQTKKGLMLDAGIGAHSATTFIIEVKGTHLLELFTDNKDLTYKASMVFSKDTNHDGILEFGMLEEPYMEEPLPYVETNYFTVYYQLDDQLNVNKTANYFINYEYNYQIEFPLDSPALEIRSSENRKYIEVLHPKTKEVLFDVFVSDMQLQSQSDWKKLAESNNLVYLTKTIDYDKSIQFTLLK